MPPSFLNISYIIQDADRDTSGCFIQFVSDAPIASDDAMTVAADIWDIIAPLQNGELRRMSFDISDWNPDGAVAADVLSDVEEAADFAFRSAEGDVSELGIPCFREDLFTGSGADKVVDTSNADVAAFISLMTTGFPLGGGNFLRHCTVHNDPTVTYYSGVQAFRPRKKKRKR